VLASSAAALIESPDISCVHNATSLSADVRTIFSGATIVSSGGRTIFPILRTIN
jgi:hypothetical protein